MEPTVVNPRRVNKRLKIFLLFIGTFERQMIGLVFPVCREFEAFQSFGRQCVLRKLAGCFIILLKDAQRNGVSNVFSRKITVVGIGSGLSTGRFGEHETFLPHVGGESD